VNNKKKTNFIRMKNDKKKHKNNQYFKLLYFLQLGANMSSIIISIKGILELIKFITRNFKE